MRGEWRRVTPILAFSHHQGEGTFAWRMEVCKMAMFLSAEQRALLDAVLDRFIPAEGAMPGAGQNGTSDYIDGVVGKSARLARLFGDGLRGVELAASKRGGNFADLDGEVQDEVLRGVEADESAFFEALLGMAYNGYYSNPEVVAALGLDARPPQPLGHEVEFGDFGSLNAVVARGTAFRET